MNLTDVSSSPRIITVTPDDDIDIEWDGRIEECIGIYVGTGGNLSVLNDLGEEVIYKNLAAGITHSISTKRIRATNTTAQDLLAIFRKL